MARSTPLRVVIRLGTFVAGCMLHVIAFVVGVQVVPTQPHAWEAGGFVLVASLPLFLIVFGVYIWLTLTMRRRTYWAIASAAAFVHGAVLAAIVYSINRPPSS